MEQKILEKVKKLNLNFFKSFLGKAKLTTKDGDTYWFKDGKFHKENGPAITLADGSNYWFLNDQSVTKEEVDQFRQRKGLKPLSQLKSKF